MSDITYRALREDEINTELFQDFIRHQVVQKCWRRVDGEWVIRDDPFIDDWTAADFEFLVSCLKNTVRTGGFVCGAFADGKLKGFVSVESELFGGENQYLDLTSIHVSEDLRGHGIGAALFLRAKRWARSHGAKKLYISAHSAVESQAFYKKMGCAQAKETCARHVEAEPFDCQLECALTDEAIVIRPYEARDFARLCRIHDPARRNELALAGLPAAFVPLSIAAEREDLFAYQLYVAELDGEVVGFVAFTEDELAWLYVDVQMQRRGIGGSLIRFALDHMEEDVSIEVLAGNSPAIAAYASFGFAIAETLSGAMPGNEAFSVTVHVMKRGGSIG